MTYQRGACNFPPRLALIGRWSRLMNGTCAIELGCLALAGQGRVYDDVFIPGRCPGLVCYGPCGAVAKYHNTKTRKRGDGLAASRTLRLVCLAFSGFERGRHDRMPDRGRVFERGSQAKA